MSTTFTLVLQPNGKALLVTKEHLAQDQVEMLKNAWNAWKSGNQDVLFISGTEVVLVEDVELELEGTIVTEQEAPAAEEPAEEPEAATEEEAEESAEEAGEEAAEE